MNKQRLVDAVMPKGIGMSTFFTAKTGQSGTIVDPKYGAVNGFNPNYAEWVSGVQERIQHGIPFLIDAPAGAQYLPNPEEFIAQLRVIMEVHPRKLEGFECGLNIEKADIPFGGGGQKLSVFTNVSRDECNLKATVDEKEGAPIRRYWNTTFRCSWPTRNRRYRASPHYLTGRHTGLLTCGLSRWDSSSQTHCTSR